MTVIDNLDNIIEKIIKGEILPMTEFDKLYNKAKEILDKRSNIAILKSPITICGCINAHFEELKDIFNICGDVSNNQYLFLGDYVGRGKNNISTFLLIISLLIKFPNNIYLLRGNHDSRHMTITWGLKDECLKKYPGDNSKQIYHKICELFDLLQIAAIIDNRIFCVHGGLSPKFKKIEEIEKIDRKKEIYDGENENTLIKDLVWSNPSEEIMEYVDTDNGIGILYGEKAVDDFLKENNNINLIIRSHECIDEGYKYLFNKKVLTIFSVPNYTEFNNIATVLKIDEKNNFNFININEHVINDESKKSYCFVI